MLPGPPCIPGVVDALPPMLFGLGVELMPVPIVVVVEVVVQAPKDRSANVLTMSIVGFMNKLLQTDWLSAKAA